MRLPATRAAIALAALVNFLPGCASISPDAPLKPVGPDYVGAGDIGGIRPMVYGARTVLEFDSLPAFIQVIDETGVDVPYERVGKYVRVSRRLAAFTVRFNLSLARFALAASRAPRLASTALDSGADTTPMAPLTVTATRVPDGASALLPLPSKHLVPHTGDASIAMARTLPASEHLMDRCAS